MRLVHERLVAYLRSTISYSRTYATGSQPGNSSLGNVKRHQKNRWFYLVDLKDAYPSVDGRKLASVLVSLNRKLHGHESEILEFLRTYCLTDQEGLWPTGLVVGGPASNDLFEIYAGKLLDEPLGELSRAWGVTYTRYIDDLTFSSPRMPIGKRKRKAIRAVIEKATLVINHPKSGVYDLRKGPVVITGIGLKLGGDTFLPRFFLRRVRGFLHQVGRNPEISRAQASGLMGCFYAAKPSNIYTLPYNQTERTLLEMFESLS